MATNHNGIETDYKYWREKFYQADENVLRMKKRAEQQDKFIQELLKQQIKDKKDMPNEKLIETNKLIRALKQQNKRLRIQLSQRNGEQVDIDPLELKKAIEEFYGLDDLCKHTRKREYAMRRQMFYYLCKTIYPDMPLKNIGAIVCRDDHSVVISGTRTFKGNMHTLSTSDKAFMSRYINVEFDDEEI